MSEDKPRRSPEEEKRKIEDTIKQITRRIAVFSGKGGVGKTTVSINLAYGLHTKGYSVGILDADITGPNVPKMLGMNSELVVQNASIIPFETYGIKMISIAALVQPGQAIIWRGPMRSKVISQFLADVEWGNLDYLIADLPPGTGDEILTIAQQMRPHLAVIVTTPQEVSVMDAERAITMAGQLEIPLIGVVENMSGFLCPHCHRTTDLFGSGGGKHLAQIKNVHFLGSIPIDIDVRKLSDKGIPIVLEKPTSEVTNAFRSIVGEIESHCKEKDTDSCHSNTMNERTVWE